MPQTADLILRPGTPQDGPAMYANLWRHPEVYRSLFSRPSPDEASQRLAQGCGFRFDYFTPAELPRNGQPVTLAHYLLCREG